MRRSIFSRKVYFLSFLIFICIALGVVFVKLHSKSDLDRNTDDSNIPNDSSKAIPSKFPDINEIDIYGRSLHSNDLISNIVYFQFISTLDSYISTESLLDNFSSSNIFKIVLFVDIKENIVGNYPGNINMHIIVNNYDNYKKLFNAPSCCDSFYLYNSDGLLIATNITANNEENIKMILNKYIKRKIFNIRTYLDRNVGYLNEILINQIYEYISISNKKYYLVAIMTSICSNCFSGTIIDKISDIYKRENIKGLYVIILLNNHSMEDIGIIKKHFNINYQIYVADVNTNALWNRLIIEYSEADLTNILVLLNNKGDVLNIMEPRCNCINAFIDRLNEILGAEI